MKQHKFDRVMDYIDEHIQSNPEVIKRGFLDLIGIDSNTFGIYFRVLTDGETLGNYIRRRRLYYAAEELQKTEKSICDIALDYGYADQSSFTRAFTAKYEVSPGEFRQKNTASLENDKYRYEDFNGADSKSIRIWRAFERTGFMSRAGEEFLDSILTGSERFGFDIDTCFAIGDLSERLGVPVEGLMQVCIDFVAEVQLAPDYIPEHAEIAMDLGISSDKDLKNHQPLNAHYIRESTGGGYWNNLKPMPSEWQISYKNLKFLISN